MNIPASHWIVYLVVCAFVAWLNGRRPRVQTPAPRTDKKPEGPVAPETPVNPTRVASPPRRARPNWISETDFCGCCGRPAVVGQLWCFDCAFHIDDNAQELHDRTWYAQHGTICPCTDLDDEREVEPDVVPEGLGPGVMRRFHSNVSPVGQWRAVDRALFDECQRGITA